MPVDTAQFGQADSSKTETHTEAPMTQIGHTAVSKLYKTEGSPHWRPNVAALGSIIEHARFIQKRSSPLICSTMYCVEDQFELWILIL